MDDREFFGNYYQSNFDYENEYIIDRDKDNFQENFNHCFNNNNITNDEFIENFMKIDHKLNANIRCQSPNVKQAKITLNTG